MSLMDVMWFGLVLVVAIALFVLKYEVQGLEEELAARQLEIAKHTKAIHVLAAEWTFLNDPARLRRLGSQHLSLSPAAPSRIVPFNALPKKRVSNQTFPEVDTQPGGPQ